MAQRLTVHRDGEAIYDIVMEPDFNGLGPEVEKLGLSERKICLVTDSNVAALYLDEVATILSKCCKTVLTFVFPAGEEHKNLDTVRSLYEHLILNHFDRKDLMAALGGGVVGDLCGFAAATYLRGVDFIQIPTTLLSQVDSSVGGKTGVDFDAYKNMVGAFHMPRLVYTNLATLKTLDGEQFSSGMGEVIKHGLIKNREYYGWLKENRDRILARDPSVCEEMVLESNRIKRDVVEKDPTEQGERALLNFGHTLGHAVEKLKDFSMFHGHCVGAGCVAAAKISAQRGLISEGEVRDIRDTMLQFSIPVAVDGLETGEVIRATLNDKKMDAGVVKFVLLNEIGKAYVDRTVTEAEMKSGLEYIMETKE
ncbi:3-dehydroquinate synthase [Enterocloster lavalensis]|uniref:3-dehydroquinate synthase n=1 Tax=Enterocloster lavalensis TaxID=460384 RepID=UPI00266550B4|nr:3-dehydroquinate synthase [Enterocloster lavalensis]